MTMDYNSLDNDEFRGLVTRFVEQNCPAELRHFAKRQPWRVVKPWFQILFARGWIAPHWPTQFGGMGLKPDKHLIYIEELERLGAPRLLDQALTNLGPILIARGTDEQRAKYLPKILSGENVWCQGYSEPNAGSDLASLRTEAVIDGDELVINGQKIWTSMAFDATHMFALVRTDKAAKKQEGISFVLFPFDQQGIEVRPIKDIAGSREFCEVFLKDVRAKLDDVVGGMNKGWGVAKTLLGFERVWAGSPRQSQIAMQRLHDVAAALGVTDDPHFRARWLSLKLDVEDLAALYQRSVRVLTGGGGFGFESSMLKIIATETCQRITEYTVDLAGSLGIDDDSVEIGGTSVDVLTSFFESRAPTIYGGSSQIQRNIIARQVLGLPA
jgi:alkylation response protein AidB-like acyl-CoA dehydrogenase